MRLASFYSSSEVQTESKRLISMFIETFSYNPPAPTRAEPDRYCSDDLKDFFNFYYENIGPTLKDLKLDNGETIHISEIEDKLIDFCISPKSETRIMVFHGQTGVGKSSMLRKIFYYCYPLCSIYKDNFKVVCKTDCEDLQNQSVDQLTNYLKKYIAEEFSNYLWNLIMNQKEKILVDNKERNWFSPYRLTDSDINEASIDLDEWIHNKYSEPSDQIELKLRLISYFQHTKKAKFVLVIDNIDTLGPKIHNIIFYSLDRLLPKLGISVIVSMRTSTYRSVTTTQTQKKDQEIEFQITSDLLKSIIKKRFSGGKEKILLHPEAAMRIPQLESITVIELYDLFTSFLNDKDCIELLVNLSNSSLKSLFEKFQFVINSPNFNDTFIASALLKTKTIRNYKNPAYVFYELLFGGVVIKEGLNPRSRKVGLVNIFNGPVTEDSYWNHFIQLYFLMYFYKWNEMSRGKDKYVFFSDFFSDYSKVFDSLLTPGTIFKVLFELITSELIVTESCQRYDETDYLEKIRDDGFKISSAGKYYLEHLIFIIEYFEYMKDDITWQIYPFPSNVVRSARQRGLLEDRYLSTVTILEYLTKYELQCLANLKSYWTGTLDESNAYKYYKLHFSPYNSINGQSLLYTELITKKFEDHMKFVMGESYEGSRLKTKFNEVYINIHNHQSLIKEYINAV